MDDNGSALCSYSPVMYSVVQLYPRGDLILVSAINLLNNLVTLYYYNYIS